MKQQYWQQMRKAGKRFKIYYAEDDDLQTWKETSFAGWESFKIRSTDHSPICKLPFTVFVYSAQSNISTLSSLYLFVQQH